MPRKLLVGGLQKTGTLRSTTPKKVSPPVVPELPARHTLPIYCNGHGPVKSEHFEELKILDAPSKGPSKPHRLPPVAVTIPWPSPSRKRALPDLPETKIRVAHVEVHALPTSLPSTPTEGGNASYLAKGRPLHGTQASLEDQGIDVSPGRDSPGASSGGSSSSGSRYSTSSLDSGRASTIGHDGKVSHRRLSSQSYESNGSPQRRSYHSSSSSIGSMEDGGHCGHSPNVAEMVLHELPDVEVLTSWLTSLHFEEYIPLFLQAGYDMPTISRMTPEDLTAIGITKPNHRRKLKAEIAKLNISDGIPDYKPGNLLEWLQLLRLEEYYITLCEQKYTTIDRVTELAWEDLEDTGIQKLGHQKKILLAIKRIQDINSGRRPSLPPDSGCITEIPRGPPVVLPRPSTLTTIPAYQYPGQEVTIATMRPKHSPSTDSIPELRTFQQSPTKAGETMQEFLTHSHGEALHQPNGVAILVKSPTRGRSLESLAMEDISTAPPSSPPTLTNTQSQNAGRDWRVTDLDGNGICDGTVTLHRPRGLVRPLPVAKISAKKAELILDEDKDIKGIIKNHPIDGWSSLEGSPRHNTLKRPPPPPPKRINSTKSTKPPVEAKKDSTPTTKQPPTQLTTSSSVPQPPPLAEEFPPPPSPLSSVVPDRQGRSSLTNDKNAPLDELFNNPLFKQRRKDSAESTSSTDSSALPFANENVATIKQKASRPYPSLLNEDQDLFQNMTLPPGARTSLVKDKGMEEVKARPPNDSEEPEYDMTPEPMSPGHVIDDIEHMLANLSDQLDAMLEDEQVIKQKTL